LKKYHLDVDEIYPYNILIWIFRKNGISKLKGTTDMLPVPDEILENFDAIRTK
jgi:hypothetical protein